MRKIWSKFQIMGRDRRRTLTQTFERFYRVDKFVIEKPEVQDWVCQLSNISLKLIRKNYWLRVNLVRVQNFPSPFSVLPQGHNHSRNNNSLANFVI